MFGFVTKGIDGKEKSIDNIAALVTKYISEIEQFDSEHENWVLLGYSFGAYVGFKIIQQLQERNKRIKKFIVLDIESPDQKAFNFFKDTPYSKKIIKSLDGLLINNNLQLT